MKKVRKEIKFKDQGGITDLFDNALKASFNITDEEYDFICENATDEEIGKFVLNDNPTFTERRQSLEVRNKYLEQFNQQK